MNIYLDRAELKSAQAHTNIDRDTTSNIARSSTGNVKSSGFALDISGTVMDNSAYAGHGRTAEEVMLTAGEQDFANRRNYMAVMSNCTSDEDFAKLYEEGFHPGSTDIETVVTIVDHIKTAMMKGGTQVTGYTDTVDKEALKNITGSEVFARELQKEFAKRDIPVTEENIAAVSEAWNTLNESGGLTEGSMKYMIENNLPPTPENFYTAKYSATEDSRQGKGYYAAGSVAGYYAKKPEQVDFEKLMPQMKKVVEEAGFTADEANLEGAKWLVEKGVPLTADTYGAYQEIKGLHFPVSVEDFMQTAACAIADGKSPSKVSLNQKETLMEKAAALAEKTANIKDEAADVISARDLPFTLKNLFAAGEWIHVSSGGEAIEQQAEAQQLKGRRLLEEVRLSMTVEANLKLLRSGYQIETAPLEELVEKLKEAESDYEMSLTRQTDVKQAAEKTSLYRTSLQILQGIRTAPVAIAAQVSEQDTLRRVHELGQNRALEYQRAGESYEALMTTPRRDMGDSIQKAFRNVDDILVDLDFALTEENSRAVRILGYNHMEINAENIRTIREKDRLLTDVVKEMKPGRVLAMIREGINPIEMSLSDLQDYLQNHENPAEEIESYSKFLYQLEQKKEITEEERSAYIGVYRLLRQIEKGDDAAVGALFKTGAEFTLENLLTAVRSSKRGNMDYMVDDNFGGVGIKSDRAETITEQIARGFDINNADLKEELEQVIRQVTEEEASEKVYEEQLFDQIRSALKTEESVLRQLVDYAQPISADTMAAMQSMLKEPLSLWKKTKELEEEESEDARDGAGDAFSKEDITIEAGHHVVESLSDKESATKAYQSMVDVLQGMIERSAYLKQDAIDVRALSGLYKQMSFLGNMAREENYEIPVNIDGNLTSINLKLIHNSKEEPKAMITFETDIFGKTAAQFKYTESGISGFCICSSKEGTAFLKENKELLFGRLAKEELQTGEIYFATGESLNLEEISLKETKERTNGESGKELYKASRAFIGFIQEMGIKKGSEAYEN